jgi:hypothetical protein
MACWLVLSLFLILAPLSEPRVAGFQRPDLHSLKLMNIISLQADQNLLLYSTEKCRQITFYAKFNWRFWYRTCAPEFSILWRHLALLHYLLTSLSSTFRHVNKCFIWNCFTVATALRRRAKHETIRAGHAMTRTVPADLTCIGGKWRVRVGIYRSAPRVLSVGWGFCNCFTTDTETSCNHSQPIEV